MSESKVKSVHDHFCHLSDVGSNSQRITDTNHSINLWFYRRFSATGDTKAYCTEFWRIPLKLEYRSRPCTACQRNASSGRRRSWSMRRTLGGTWTPISQAFSRTSRPVSPRRRTTWSLGNCQLNKNIKAYTYLATYMHACIHTYARACVFDRRRGKERRKSIWKLRTLLTIIIQVYSFSRDWSECDSSLSLFSLYIIIYFFISTTAIIRHCWNQSHDIFPHSIIAETCQLFILCGVRIMLQLQCDKWRQF